MIINEILYISGAFLLSLKKDPEFAPDKLGSVVILGGWINIC